MNDPKPGLFRHFKGGMYNMFGVAWPSPTMLAANPAFTYLHTVKHSETKRLIAVFAETIADGGVAQLWTCDNSGKLERLVIYQSTNDQSRWARPFEMWHSLIPTPESMGDAQRRFTRVGD